MEPPVDSRVGLMPSLIKLGINEAVREDPTQELVAFKTWSSSQSYLRPKSKV